MSKSGFSSNLVKELQALGNICRHQGDLIRAEQHYRLALSLYETSFPESHVEAILALLGLVQVLENQGRRQEAEQFEKAIPVMNARRRD
jgi:tetratricopeptide (TPR) repeat protein